jgi:hypothetical protein
MTGIAQLGVAFSALGIVLAFMGLFPGVTGIDAGRGVGIVQYATILLGFALLNVGALVYVKYTFYPNHPSNLAQQVGVRLTLTGLLLASMAGVRQRYGRWLRSEIRQASCFADGKVKFFCDAWYESGDVTEIFVWQVTGSKAALVLYRPSPGRQPAPGDHPTLSPPCPK